MKLPIYTIDAFTDKAFAGNPAGVCITDKALPVELMQKIAAEMNHSETAFLVPDINDSEHFAIRYFTPQAEIGFCGHATLASAKFLFEKYPPNKIKLSTHSGIQIEATEVANGIKMGFPVYQTETFLLPPALTDALGITAFTETFYAPNPRMLAIVIEDENQLIHLKPDFSALQKSIPDLVAVIVTCPSAESDIDFKSRVFCPWVGIAEDPVTGSAHSVIAAYWANRLGNTSMQAHQASARGGDLYLELGNENLWVTGNAVIVLEGNLIIS